MKTEVFKQICKTNIHDTVI